MSMSKMDSIWLHGSHIDMIYFSVYPKACPRLLPGVFIYKNNGDCPLYQVGLLE